MILLKQVFDAAFEEARRAEREGEIPVGAVVFRGEEILARAHNRREKDRRPTAHAELLAIEEAARVLGDWRLSDCSLAVTLEPCLMCAGTIINARIKRIYFAAYDRDFGAMGSRYQVFDKRYEIYGGLYEAKASAMLSEFFQQRRKGED